MEISSNLVAFSKNTNFTLALFQILPTIAEHTKNFLWINCICPELFQDRQLICFFDLQVPTLKIFLLNASKQTHGFKTKTLGADWLGDYRHESEYNTPSKIISPHFKKAGLLMVALQCCFNANWKFIMLNKCGHHDAGYHNRTKTNPSKQASVVQIIILFFTFTLLKSLLYSSY